MRTQPQFDSDSDRQKRVELTVAKEYLKSGLLLLFIFALSFFLLGWIPANRETVKAHMVKIDKYCEEVLK